MRIQTRESAEVLMDSARALMAGVLCVLMVEQPMVAAAAVNEAWWRFGEADSDARAGAGAACAEPIYVWATAGRCCGGAGDGFEAVV